MYTTELEHIVEQIKAEVKAQASGQEGANAKLLDSIERLRRAVEPPAQRMSRLRSQILQNVILLMAEEMGLVDTIVERKGDNVKLVELSHITGYNKDLIARIMRLLTAIGVCDEVEETTYRSNEMAESQIQPVSKGGLVLSNDLVLPVGAKIRSYVRGLKETGPVQASTDKGPFAFAFGMSVWEALKQDPKLKKAFDDNLAGRSKLHPVRWHDKYPAAAEFDRNPGKGTDEVLVVDIGGNQGYDLISFHKQNPQLPGRLVLQDLPETLAQIASPLQGIEAMAHDFFTPQPILGARLYYLHSVCHDWSDSRCRDILSHIAKSMDLTSRLLIDELVLKDVGESISSAEMDILMLMLCNGGERSLYQWKNLLTSATPSLRIVRVWRAPGEQQSIIEAAV